MFPSIGLLGMKRKTRKAAEGTVVPGSLADVIQGALLRRAAGGMGVATGMGGGFGGGFGGGGGYGWMRRPASRPQGPRPDPFAGRPAVNFNTIQATKAPPAVDAQGNPLQTTVPTGVNPVTGAPPPPVVTGVGGPAPSNLPTPKIDVNIDPKTGLPWTNTTGTNADTPTSVPPGQDAAQPYLSKLAKDPSNNTYATNTNAQMLMQAVNAIMRAIAAGQPGDAKYAQYLLRQAQSIQRQVVGLPPTPGMPAFPMPPAPANAAKGAVVKHVGFENAAEKAAKGEGVSLERGRAIIAASAHKASAAAVRKNPRLKKVSGMFAGGLTRGPQTGSYMPRKQSDVRTEASIRRARAQRLERSGAPPWEVKAVQVEHRQFADGGMVKLDRTKKPLPDVSKLQNEPAPAMDRTQPRKVVDPGIAPDPRLVHYRSAPIVRAPRRGGRPIRRSPFHAAAGKSVSGPAIILVGEGKHNEGVAAGTHEYLMAPPGTVVAPGRKGEKPTMQAAIDAIRRQLMKTGIKEGSDYHNMMHAAAGHVLDEAKAKTILRDGSVRGHKLSPKQRRFFGLIAGGGKPTRAAAGYITIAGRPGVNQMNTGSLYDPLGGADPELKALFANGLPTYAQQQRMSSTQRGLMDASLSAGKVDPQDFWDRVMRDYQGFNPSVQAGATARYGRAF